MNIGASRKEGSRSRLEEIYRKAEADRQATVFDKDPLKQYIRRYGWLNIVKDYQANMRQQGVERSLKILTLPGENATDIGLFFREGIVFTNEDRIFNVAICDVKFALSVQANVAGLGSLLAISDKELSQTLERDNHFINLFPFDVVNLDFCDQLFALSNDTNLLALQKIFHLQSGQAFLLLLTNRCNSLDDQGQREQAESIMSANMSIDNFKHAYVREFGGENIDLCMSDYVKLTQMIYPKVIARLARDYGFQVTERFAAHYSRRDGDYHMVCHSFEMSPLDRSSESLRFSPNPRRTKSAVIGRLVFELPEYLRRRSNQEYEQFVTQVVERETVNIDEIINSNRCLRTTLEAEAVSLENWWDRPGLGAI
jgi:hypothetical protein